MHPFLVLFALPLLGIPLFFFLPLATSIPAYLFLLVLSGLSYWITIRAMQKRPTVGAEGLIGMEAWVFSKLRPGDEAGYLVKIRGETWSASSSEKLDLGEKVKILKVNGIILQVEKTSHAVSPPAPPHG